MKKFKKKKLIKKSNCISTSKSSFWTKTVILL